MIRDLLALALWCLCAVVGLRTTRESAESAEQRQRLHEKWKQNVSGQAENKHLEIRVEQEEIQLDQRPDTDTDEYEEG